jgi:cation transport ATPase
MLMLSSSALMETFFGKDARPVAVMKEKTRPQEEKAKDRFFLTPTFQALTIGVPFCIFKLLFGLLALRAGSLSVPLFVLGWLVIVWALADLLMNLARVFFHLAGREAPLEYCTIAQAGRIFKRPRLFLAIDTLITFSIICFVLWSGWIVRLSQEESYLWYAATTLNLISISAVNIRIELMRK